MEIIMETDLFDLLIVNKSKYLEYIYKCLQVLI